MTTRDAAARRRITEDLDSTLFVEAGAGTGKTTALVGRVTALLRRGAPVTSLVVITFTRAAAAELRERVRRQVTAARDEANEGSAEREKLDEALHEMDFAVIQTIDSFALSMLRERPLEAGLPPVIEPVDEVQAELEFDDAWSRWLDDQPVDGEFASAIANAFHLGLNAPLTALYDTARQLHANYHLVADHDFKETGAVPRVAARAIVDAGRWLPGMERFCLLPEGDELTASLETFDELVRRLEKIGPETADADWLLARLGKITQSRGRQIDWDDDESGVNACKSVKASLKKVQDLLDDELAGLRRHAAGALLEPLREFVTGYAEERRSAGRAEFHDMLVWAVNLLDDDSARLHFQDRYRYVLVDEFQDTDPLQVELVRRLTDREGVGRPTPGALFVVGDPKQSIYRFRHADLPTLNRLRSEVGDGLTLITQNFRSNTSLVGWVNHVFERWMDGEGSPYQADYVALESDDVPPEAEPRFGVHLVGEALAETRVDAVRRVEMADLARIAREIGDGRWTVHGKDGPRASTFGDLCILIPRRTALPLLERALEEHGAPFTTAGNSLIFVTEEVRDLLSALTAIDDPTDQVAVVAALRSPAYACSDADLWSWSQAGNGFNFLGGADSDNPGTGGPVARAFESLRALHGERLTVSPAALIERFVRERRLRELAIVGGRTEERWSRIQFLAEMARRLAEAGRPTLRDFVLWARQQAERDVRAPDAATGEAGDAVRVMTVHAAKGLEFPIVMLTGLNSALSTHTENVLFDHHPDAPVPIGVRMGSGGVYFETGEFDALRDQEKDAGKLENVRLMYVAATRARDHLIVSTFRKDKDRTSPAALVARYSEDAPELWSPAASPVAGPGVAPQHQDALPPVITLDDPDGWERQQNELIRRMSASRLVAASSLHESGDAPPPPKTEDEQIELDPWRRGRAASAIGRAVHAVLQDVDLGESSVPGMMEMLSMLAARHAPAHDVASYEQEISELAAATLKAPVMQRAADAYRKGRAWRESYVSAAVGEAGVIVEGYVDLLFEEEDGSLVIVDYKTDRSNAAAEQYEMQLGAYVAAVRTATGRVVDEAVLVFSRLADEALKNGSDVEKAQHRVPDLDAAVDHAIRLAEAELASAR